MHKNTKDLTGIKFNKLTAVSKSENIGGRVSWLFLCDCGVYKSIISTNVVSGKSKSCGCGKVKHGNSEKPEYHSWYSAIDRCTNSTHHAWGRYGGRGITVCERWMSFDLFIEDMGCRPSGKHQLDRSDNEKGYCKSNCKWVLPVDNVRNRADSKYWFIDGVRYESMRHAADSVGVAHSTIKDWCNKGINGCYSERKYL